MVYYLWYNIFFSMIGSGSGRILINGPSGSGRIFNLLAFRIHNLGLRIRGSGFERNIDRSGTLLGEKNSIASSCQLSFLGFYQGFQSFWKEWALKNETFSGPKMAANLLKFQDFEVKEIIVRQGHFLTTGTVLLPMEMKIPD
jgi:hypothetical protein